MAAIGAIPPDALAGYTVLGELALDGSITAVAGVLPAAIAAYARGQGLICPAASGPEAAWAAADMDILAPRSLIQLANHFKGTQVMARPEPAIARQAGPLPDLADVRGQESAKRVLEIAAAGAHNLLMSCPIIQRIEGRTGGYEPEVPEAAKNLELVDLTVAGQRRIGVNGNALSAGPRSTYDARGWAEAIHIACPRSHGINHSSHRYGPDFAVVLFGDRLPPGASMTISTRAVADAECHDAVRKLAQSLSIEYVDV